VNSQPIDIGVGFIFDTGGLLFKGPQADIERYQGADGNMYEDLKYVFGYRQGGEETVGGWNAFLRPDLKAGKRDYGPIERKNPGAPPGSGDPLYPLANHQHLFVPAVTVDI